MRVATFGLVGLTWLTGCGGGDGDAPKAGALGDACEPAAATCDQGLVCAEVTTGDHRCFGEAILRGHVEDASDASPIEGALVMALNDEGAAVTTVATTDAKGNYELAVPVVRQEDGTPVSSPLTLRSAAEDYQAFPGGARVALPIDPSTATADGSRYVVETALTTIDLVPLPAGARSRISGSIVPLDSASKAPIDDVLVVAKGSAGAASGLTDKTGHFTIFNVTPGDYELRAYGADLQVESQSVTIQAEPLEGVELHQLDQATTTLTGNVQIVNAPGTSATSVVLVVEDTFDPVAARGEVPNGLRAPRNGPPSVTGSFTISGVPAGNYVVLAAYENDDLVRDPDTNIAGTDFVHVQISANQPALDLSDSFKVTAALATMSPGADGPEAVQDKPVLVWADDSSENFYDLRVFDALGNEVWNSLMLPAVKGSSTVEVPYAGPLEPGMYYQFRASSWRAPGKGDAAPISTTEDLRGVFFLPASK